MKLENAADGGKFQKSWKDTYTELFISIRTI